MENIEAQVIRRTREGMSDEAFERLCASAALDGQCNRSTRPRADRFQAKKSWLKLDRAVIYTVEFMAEREGFEPSIRG